MEEMRGASALGACGDLCSEYPLCSASRGIPGDQGQHGQRMPRGLSASQHVPKVPEKWVSLQGTRRGCTRILSEGCLLLPHGSSHREHGDLPVAVGCCKREPGVSRALSEAVGALVSGKETLDNAVL